VNKNKILYINRDDAKAKKLQDLLAPRAYRLISAPGGPEAKILMDDPELAFVIYDTRIILEEGAAFFLEIKSLYPYLPVVAAAPIWEKEEEKISKTIFDGVNP